MPPNTRMLARTLITQKTSGVGALSSLEKNPYSIDDARYPLEGLGDEECPHYVTFNINLPETSKYVRENSNNLSAEKSRSQQNYDFNETNNPNGTFNNKNLNVGLAAGISLFSNGPISAALVGVAGASAKSDTAGITLRPKLKRIKKSISIYMPDTLQAQYSHSHDGVSLTQALGNLGIATALGADIAQNAREFGGAAKQYAKDLLDPNVEANFNPQLSYNTATAEAVGKLAESSGAVGAGFSDLTLKSAGKALNPQVELIFRGTANREFVFDFQFQPRSAKEATHINDIIQTFKAYAAPELANEGNGRYLIPPGQFDIKFMFRNRENDAIAKISTCVLTNITVNYAGAGAFATFDDGNPVQINLSLIFKEADIITRDLIEKEGY